MVGSGDQLPAFGDGLTRPLGQTSFDLQMQHVDLLRRELAGSDLAFPTAAPLAGNGEVAQRRRS
jgi:hypothetical protein